MGDAADPVEEYLAERQERIQQRLGWISQWQVWPEQIATMMGRHVIGQDEAVRRMGVLLRAHVLRLHEAIEDGTVLQAPRRRGEGAPVLLIGPSGVGKTHLIRTMAQMTSLPCAVEDATSQSSTGYVGRSVSDILASLMTRSEADLGLARWGIVAIDELDKIRRRNAFGGVDVSGEGVQRSMLSLLDGGSVQFEWPPGGSRGERTWCSFTTSNLMVILSGAFDRLDEVVARRLGIGQRRIGFGAAEGADAPQERQSILSQVVPDDLVEYGFLPEVVGRIRDIVVMRDLTADDLRRILMEAPSGPLAVAQQTARREGFRFTLSDDLVDGIVRDAMSRGLGARSLHSILSRVTQRAFYELPPYTHGRKATRTVELGLAALHDGSYTLLPTRKRRSKATDPETTPET